MPYNGDISPRAYIMDAAVKFKLLNQMGRCEARPRMPPSAIDEQKYQVIFKIWIGTTWEGYLWEYSSSVDGAVDKVWDSLKEELWIIVGQLKDGHTR